MTDPLNIIFGDFGI